MPTTDPTPIVVTATDPIIGETDTQDVSPGGYCLIVAEPTYLASEYRYVNGTVMLTIKQRGRDVH